MSDGPPLRLLVSTEAQEQSRGGDCDGTAMLENTPKAAPEAKLDTGGKSTRQLPDWKL